MKRFFLIAAVIVAIPLLYLGWWCLHIEGLQKVQLAECNSPVLDFDYTFPPGSHFNLALAVPISSSQPLSIHGEVKITQGGDTVAKFTIEPADFVKCGWISDPKFQGYILNGHATDPKNLLSKLSGRQAYHFSIQFMQQPPTGSSILLTSLRSKRDEWNILQ